MGLLFFSVVTGVLGPCWPRVGGECCRAGGAWGGVSVINVLIFIDVVICSY